MSITKDPKQNPENEQQLSDPQGSGLLTDDDEAAFSTFFAEAPTQKKHTKQKRKMSRGVKGVVCGAGVVVLLGGTLAVLKLTEQEEPVDSSSTVDTSGVVSLWNIADSGDIAAIQVEQPNGTDFSVHRVIEQQESTDSTTGEVVVNEVENYYLDGYEDLPTETVDIRTLATRVASISSSDIIQENATTSDLAKYGLDQPIRVTLTVDDADDICFLLGDISPSSYYSYLCMDGENTVYTVQSSSMAQYRVDWKDYLSTDVTEEQSEYDDSYVEEVRIERDDLDYDFDLVYDSFYVENSSNGSSAVHVMKEPINCLLSGDKSSGATHGIYAMTASQVYYPHPDADMIAACGVTDNRFFARVTTKISTGKTVTFYLGHTYETEIEDENGELQTVTYRFGYIDTVDCIYGFASDDTVYETLKPEDITSKIIVDTYVWDIGRLTYTAGDLQLDFEGVGTSADDYVVTCNGEDVETERFRLLYTYLLKAAAEDLVLEDVAVTGTPLATVELERQDGKRSMSVAFYEADGMKTYIVVDGEVRFLCRKAYVTTLISNMEIFHTDQDFTMTW